MKKMKKMASFLLAMLMALALAVPAMASTNDGSNLGDDAASVQTRTYDIYQIFTGTYVDEVDDDNQAPGEVLSDIKWGKNGTGTEGEKVDKDTLDTIAAAGGTNATDRAILDVILDYANLEGTPFMQGVTANNDGTVTIPVNQAGYYLIKDNGTTAQNGSVMSYVVQVLGDTLEFEPKVGVPGPDKKIVEGTNKVDHNVAAIGEVVTYELYATMPRNIGTYNKYYLAFHDTLSKGLNAVNVDNNGNITSEITESDTGLNVALYVGTYEGTFDPQNVDVNSMTRVSADYSVNVEVDNEGSKITVAITDVKNLGIDITENTVIVARYDAVVNDEALIYSDANPNDVYLEYSNNPNSSGEGEPGPNNPNNPTGETPKKTVETYTTELKIQKTGENNQNLAGAGFVLKGENLRSVKVTTGTTFVKVDEGATHYKLTDGTYTTEAPAEGNEDLYASGLEYKLAEENGLVKTAQDSREVYGEVNSEGQLTFTGLCEGTYTITEVKTPDGYNTIVPFSFTVTFDETTKAFVVDMDGDTTMSVAGGNTLSTTIQNLKGATLPETGGIGTTIFYVVGGALVIGAVVLLVTKKRMSNIEE